MRHTTAILALLFAVGCDDDEIVWAQFNEEGQDLEVAVGDPVTPCPEPGTSDLACRIDLKSNLGVTLVGTATVDPASGPVGTEHLVTVVVFDDFESLVGRATVVVESSRTSDPDGDGDPETRGGAEFEMRRDSADVGAYALSLQSLGSQDETGKDTFTIRLFQPEQLAGESYRMSDPEEPDEGDLPDRLFFRIGEAAELVGVEPHVLRYWEAEFGLQPERSTSGQRLYRRNDIARFLRIRRLLHDEGFTIAGARKALHDGSTEMAGSVVDTERVHQAMERIRSVRERIGTLRERIGNFGVEPI